MKNLCSIVRARANHHCFVRTAGGCVCSFVRQFNANQMHRIVFVCLCVRLSTTAVRFVRSNLTNAHRHREAQTERPTPTTRHRAFQNNKEPECVRSAKANRNICECLPLCVCVQSSQPTHKQQQQQQQPEKSSLSVGILGNYLYIILLLLSSPSSLSPPPSSSSSYIHTYIDIYTDILSLL